SDAYLVGEIPSEAQDWLQGDMFDGVMNYQFTAAVVGFFGDRYRDDSMVAGMSKIMCRVLLSCLVTPLTRQVLSTRCGQLSRTRSTRPSRVKCQRSVSATEIIVFPRFHSLDVDESRPRGTGSADGNCRRKGSFAGIAAVNCLCCWVSSRSGWWERA
ncbi:MAG: hypothetical protein P8049_08385, partial [Gemmatimonadota bacterium]